MAARNSESSRNNEIFCNTFSVLMLLALVPQLNNGSSNDSTAVNRSSFPLIIFVFVAAANHLLPHKFEQSATHFVKAAWTVVLFEYVPPRELKSGTAWITASELVATVMSLGPILAIVLAGAVGGNWIRFAYVTEALGSFPRQLLMLFGVYAHAFSPLRLLICAVLCAVYMAERRTRIRRQERSHYGLLHVAEHVHIFIYLAGVIGDVEVARCITTALCVVFVLGVVIPVLAVRATNHWLQSNALARLPTWFDKENLLPLLQKKLAGNTEKMRVRNVLTKLVGYLAPQFVSWKRMEALSAALAVNDAARSSEPHPPLSLASFDLCVGVLSGGAFVAPAVANAWNIPERAYIASRLYSGQSFLVGWWQTVELFLGPALSRRLRLVHAPVVQDITLSATIRRMKAAERPLRRVLVVDDSVFSGRSLSAARDYVAAATGLPISCVYTAALFVDSKNAKFEPDFLATRGPVPWAWEWGVEVD